STAPGAILLNMEMSGYQAALMPAGHPIAMATGSRSILGGGPGLKTSRGVTLRSTTAAGCTGEASGDGLLAQSTFAHTTLRHWSRGLAALAGVEVSASALVAAEDLAGAR